MRPEAYNGQVARSQSYVARNFIILAAAPNILIALVSFHQIFKNKIYY